MKDYAMHLVNRLNLHKAKFKKFDYISGWLATHFLGWLFGFFGHFHSCLADCWPLKNVYMSKG